jgi:hypothetical protein
VAYAALCNIYCRKGGNPFTKENLNLFYKSILDGLNGDDLIIINSIMLNSCKIFSFELEGSFSLIPTYVKTVSKILSVAKNQTNPYSESLRASCITMLGSLICLPNHYGFVNSEIESNFTEVFFFHKIS